MSSNPVERPNPKERIGLLVQFRTDQYDYLARHGAKLRLRGTGKRGLPMLGKAPILRGVIQGLLNADVAFAGTDTEETIAATICDAMMAAKQAGGTHEVTA